MDIYGWLQLALFLGLLLLLTKPCGLYLVRVLDGEGRTFLDPVMKPLEHLLYRICGIDSQKEQGWLPYAVSLIMFSLVGMIFTYAILRLQYYLPLNPQRLPGLSPDLAFNTAASFTTNTNWQSYGGESTMSYFSQMVALTLHNFLSAAAGIAVAAALIRGIVRNTAKTLGNFWVDVIRVNIYLLLPLCLIYAVFLLSQGVIQNFSPYQEAKVIEPHAIQMVKKDTNGQEIRDAQGKIIMEDKKIDTQIIAQGPMASQVAIKMLGTNGGGFMNANAAHPYENPTPLSNLLQMLSIFLIPSGLTYYFGRMIRNQQHGWAIWKAMAIVFLAGVLICWWAEAAGNPHLTALGLDPASGNMEGKEVRFGIFNSALFATVTTGASCGAVNAMHDSLTPLGGLIPLLNIQLGEIIFGGVGAGLYGMLVFVILTVFLAGLMVGRTPEYLGKKIEAYDVKLSAVAILVLCVTILGFAACATVGAWGKAGLNNAGPHGLTEMIYAFSSAVGNNGSAFAGFNTNTIWLNSTMAVAMLIGRFFFIIPVLALAGNMAGKKRATDHAGSFPVTGLTFVLLLIGTVLIVGALTFFPALALGPIVEHFIMTGTGKLF
jgi:K+-transporting ATPase ATPase A chain